MKRGWLALLLVAGCGSDDDGPPPDAGSTPDGGTADASSDGGAGDCTERARALVDGWRAEGLEDEVVQQRYQVALASCAGEDVDPLWASLIGHVNFDYTLLARQVVAGSLDPATYVGLVRDRSHKRRMGTSDPAWLEAYGRGDEDADFVPDERDLCPGTAPYTATSDDGCATAPDAQVNGTAGDLARYFELVGVVGGLGCVGAPVPATPVPLRAGLTAADRTLVAISRIDNQPAGCPLIIEIEGTYFYDRVGLPSELGSVPIHLALRSGEVMDPNADPLVFAAGPNDSDFLANAPGDRVPRFVEWRARAMNGSGLLSSWSGLYSSTDFTLTE